MLNNRSHLSLLLLIPILVSISLLHYYKYCHTSPTTTLWILLGTGRIYLSGDCTRGSASGALGWVSATRAAPASNLLQATGVPLGFVMDRKGRRFHPEKEMKVYESWEEGKRDWLDQRTAQKRPRTPFPVSLLSLSPAPALERRGWLSRGVRQGQPGRASPNPSIILLDQKVAENQNIWWYMHPPSWRGMQWIYNAADRSSTDVLRERDTNCLHI